MGSGATALPSMIDSVTKGDSTGVSGRLLAASGVSPNTAASIGAAFTALTGNPVFGEHSNAIPKDIPGFSVENITSAGVTTPNFVMQPPVTTDRGR